MLCIICTLHQMGIYCGFPGCGCKIIHFMSLLISWMTKSVHNSLGSVYLNLNLRSHTTSERTVKYGRVLNNSWWQMAPWQYFDHVNTFAEWYNKLFFPIENSCVTGIQIPANDFSNYFRTEWYIQKYVTMNNRSIEFGRHVCWIQNWKIISRFFHYREAHQFMTLLQNPLKQD